MRSKPNPENRHTNRSHRSRKRIFQQNVYQSLKTGTIPEEITTNDILYALKYKLTEREADQLLDKLDDNVFEEIIAYPVIETYDQIGKGGIYLFDCEFENEIKWVTKFIKDYAEEITGFLAYESKFEKALFSGDYENASSLIDKLESDISVSIWSIQQRFFVAELSKGFKSNKELLTTILESQNAPIVNFIANYVSIRIEKNVSLQQFQKLVDNYIELVKSNDLTEYILFKVNFFRRSVSLKSLPIILCCDSSLSIIDRYNTFLQVSQYVFSKRNKPDNITGHFYIALNEIRKYVNDYRIDILLMIHDGQYRKCSDDIFLKIIDEYTLGNYELVITLSIQYLKDNPNNFRIITVYCKSIYYLGITHNSFVSEGSVLNEAIILMLRVFKREDQNLDLVYSDLYKLATIFGNHHFALDIVEFLQGELPFLWTGFSDIDLSKLATISGGQFNPSIYQFVRPAKKEALLKELKTELSLSATINLLDFLSLQANNRALEFGRMQLRELKYLAIFLRSTGKTKQSIEVSDYILNSNRFTAELNLPYIYNDIVASKFHSLIELKRWIEAAELASLTLVKHPSFTDRFLNPFLLEYLIDSQDPKLLSQISVPIYLKFFENNLDAYEVYVAYDNFLSSHNCETPKDYFKLFDPSDLLSVAFLEHVCKHEVLYSSPFFKDQEEMDLARIDICNFLLEKGCDSNSIETEISDLLRRVLVRKGIQQIDYSKIYVDVKGLKEKVSKELKDNFNRNIEIASLPVNQIEKIVDSVGNLLVYYMDNQGDEDFKVEGKSDKELVEKIKLTSYSRLVSFKESFLKIRDMFLFDTDCGLDTYLSMRIRHGTLPGQIRSIFENHKLITSWNEVEMKYLPNEYWVHKFPNLNEENIRKLTLAFDKFSKEIDQQSENLKNLIIQISTEIKPSMGMFDYSFNEQELINLFSQRFGPIKEFDQFVNAVFQTLWERTEVILEKMREYLNLEFISKINGAFETLTETIENTDGFREHQQPSQELLALLGTARTEFGAEITKIADWFRRSNKKYIEEFDFGLLLDSSVSALKRNFVDVIIDVNNKYTEKIDGEYFPYFTDIFIYLLHNALKHSKLSGNKLRIGINIYQEDDCIVFRIENNVLDEEAHILRLNERINKSLTTLSDPRKVGQAISKEGGTGYPKIKKALTSDLKRKKCEIKFGLEQNRNAYFFLSEIKSELDGLQKESDI